MVNHMHKLNAPIIQRAAIAHQQGFTLIEIIVALTIGVLMTTAGYQALRSAVASIEQMNHTIEPVSYTHLTLPTTSRV